MKEKIIILTLILIFSTLHACLSVGEGEITLSRHKLILKNNGSLDIVRGDRKILPGLGFALWRKGWTDFTHQSWWQNGEIYESLGVLRVEGVEEYGEILLNYRIEVLTGSWKKAVLTRASIDVDTELEALAWGSWNLETSKMQDKIWIFYTFTEKTEVHFPQKISKTPIYLKHHVIAVVLPEEKLALIPLTLTSVSVEDERNRGSSAFSLRFWIEDSGIELLIVEYDDLDLNTFISIVKGVLFTKNRKIIEEFAQNILRGKIDEAYALTKPPLEELPSPPWLKTENFSIMSEDREYVLLQGVNCMGLEFGWFGHSEEDFKRITSWGFNVIRLPIGWAYIEPEPGVINEEYLKIVDWMIYWAKKHGLYVVLDMHQWRWSNRYGGCGFQDWLVPDAEDYLEASVRFFKNRELWREFAEVWKIVAERYKNESTIAAYDVFNEPMPHYDLVPKREFVELVEEFYKYIFEEIRKIDKKHILMYMPVWGSELDAVPWITGENIVLTIHFYVGGTWDGKTGYEKTSFAELKRAVQECVKLGLERGIPVWIGEFGVGSSAYGASDWVKDVSTLFEEHALGYAWWTYWRDEGSFGLLYPDGKEKEHIMKILDRPRILSSTCKPSKIFFNVENRDFTACLEMEKEKCRVLIYLPKRHYKTGFKLSIPVAHIYSFDYRSRVLKLVLESNESSIVEIKVSKSLKDKVVLPTVIILSFFIIFVLVAYRTSSRAVVECDRKSTHISVGKTFEDGRVLDAANAVSGI